MNTSLGIHRSARAMQLIASVLLAAAATLQADVVTLRYERAPDPAGPWTQVSPQSIQVNADGSAHVLSDKAKEFYRVRILDNGQESTKPILALDQVPAGGLLAARRHLSKFLQDSNTFDGAWVGARLAPFAFPVGSPTGGGGFVELKIQVDPTASTKPGGFRTQGSDEDESTDRGYILCSLDDTDLPILEFRPDGHTITETLLRKCGSRTPAKIIRYAAGFWVAEDERGNLIANHGTEPFRIPAEALAMIKSPAAGDIDTETGEQVLPPRLGLKPTYFRSYAEFKDDYLNNPVHQLLRRRRAEYAKIQWNLERGILPRILEVRAGQTQTFLTDLRITDSTLHWEGRLPLADIAILRAGGIQVIGRSVGSAPLTVRIGETVQEFVINVRPAVVIGLPTLADVAAPEWKTTTYAHAGTWQDQMHWWQLRSDNWCPLVGCGPTALGMLVGYWDKKGVESAFYKSSTDFNSISTSDAPQELDTTSKRVVVRAAYDIMHDACDVICNPFGDEGATMPGDFIEGFSSYMFPVASGGGISSLVFGKGKPLVGYSSSWAYDWGGGDWEESGRRVANGIKSGRPGVIGLGWLWHYAVAYAYAREDLMVNVNGTDVSLGVRRYLKCNEGWKSLSPSWYDAHEVFLGLTVNMWQKTVPTLP